MLASSNNLPLVSVITLSYRKFDYIYEAIDSVLKQDYPAIEYLIGDDGAENFPEQEIRNYIASRGKTNIKKITIIHHERNLGIVRNYNSILKYVSGKYLFNLAADDQFYDDTVISKVVSKFKKLNSEVIVCSRYFTKENGELLYLSPRKAELFFISRMKTNLDQHFAIVTGRFYNFASGSAMYYDVDMLKARGGFDENYVLWEDGPFIAQYTASKKINYAYEIVCVKYRLGGASNSTVPNMLMLEDSKKFGKIERLRCIDKFGWYRREQLRYYQENSVCSNVFRNNVIKVRYFHAYVEKKGKKILFFLVKFFLRSIDRSSLIKRFFR